MKGMILAAGHGTRFQPVTFLLPKPMIPLCNRPLIEYAVDSLLSSGVRDIIVNLHHLPESLETHLRRTYPSNVNFEFSFEKEILGTGGALRKVRESLQNEEMFYLVNGDTIQFPPLERLGESLRRNDAIAALLLRHPPAGDRFTKVFFDGELVTGFGEGAGEPLMFSGSHAISKDALDLLPDRDFSGITEDVYVPMLRNGTGRLAGVVHDGLWFDIGTPRRYQIASDELRMRMVLGEMEGPNGTLVDASSGSLIARDAEVTEEVVRSVVGRRSIVASGATVDRSILWERVAISANCVVVGSIVIDDVSIPSGFNAVNALICRFQPVMEKLSRATRIGDLLGVPIDPDGAFAFES